MDSIISTFHIDWKIIIAQAVNFGVVFIVLYIFALKPLSKLMAERSEKIKKGIDDAKRSDELLEKAAQEYEQNTIKLKKISVDAKVELVKDLERLKAEHLAKIKMDNEEWEKNRKKQIEIDKENIIKEVTADVAALAMQAAEKIIKEKQDLKKI